MSESLVSVEPNSFVDPEKEKTILLEKFLERVDFSALNGLFAEIQKRAGVSAPMKITKEDVVLLNPTDPRLEEFEFEEGTIGFYLNGVVYLAPYKIPAELPEEAQQVLFIHSLIHESLHKASSEHIPFGRALDEALTETISLEILKDYLRRTGISASRSISNSLEEAGVIKASAYIYDRLSLHILTKLLAHRLEIDEMLIQQALVKEYFLPTTSRADFIAHMQEALKSLFPVLDSYLRRNPEHIVAAQNEREELVQTDTISVNEMNELVRRVNNWDQLDVFASALKLR